MCLIELKMIDLLSFYTMSDALEVDFMPNVIDSPARGHGGRCYHALNRVRYLWDLPQT
jgi:hypothetical protein